MTGANRYFRIGIFVLIAILILIALLFVIGIRPYFKPKIQVETYFDESVDGLSLGSAVKYRGVKIGQVDKIDFTNYQYPQSRQAKDNAYRYVFVQMAINLPEAHGYSLKKSGALIKEMVKSGLRVSLAPEGLTGSSYLELNFYPVKSLHNLTFSWKPKENYIPSKPSTLTQLSSALSQVINNINNMHLDKLTQHLDQSIIHIDEAAQNMNRLLVAQKNNVTQTLNSIKQASLGIQGLTQNLSQYPSSLIFSNPPKSINLGTH